MKTASIRLANNLSWAFIKALNLIGFIGRRVAREVTNRPKHNVTIVNSNTGEVLHEASSVSTMELNKVLDAMRALKGTVQIIVKTVK